MAGAAGRRRLILIELLYPLITEAIRRAETLEDLRAPGAHSAYLDVSLLEERITEFLPACDPEGALARRGAVRAALACPRGARRYGLGANRYRGRFGCDCSRFGDGCCRESDGC